MPQNDILQHSLQTFVRFTQHRKASVRIDTHAEKKEKELLGSQSNKSTILDLP